MVFLKVGVLFFRLRLRLRRRCSTASFLFPKHHCCGGGGGVLFLFVLFAHFFKRRLHALKFINVTAQRQNIVSITVFVPKTIKNFNGFDRLQKTFSVQHKTSGVFHGHARGTPRFGLHQSTLPKRVPGTQPHDFAAHDRQPRFRGLVFGGVVIFVLHKHVHAALFNDVQFLARGPLFNDHVPPNEHDVVQRFCNAVQRVFVEILKQRYAFQKLFSFRNVPRRRRPHRPHFNFCPCHRRQHFAVPPQRLPGQRGQNGTRPTQTVPQGAAEMQRAFDAASFRPTLDRNLYVDHARNANSIQQFTRNVPRFGFLQIFRKLVHAFVVLLFLLDHVLVVLDGRQGKRHGAFQFIGGFTKNVVIDRDRRTFLVRMRVVQMSGVFPSQRFDGTLVVHDRSNGLPALLGTTAVEVGGGRGRGRGWALVPYWCRFVKDRFVKDWCGLC